MGSVKAGRRAIIASYAGPRAFAPQASAALERLGYELRSGLDNKPIEPTPELFLVEERYLGRLPSLETDPDTPIVLITGTRAPTFADPRVIGSVERPAELEELYALLQHALEETPRSAPRVPTQIAARCTRSDELRLVGAVLSLSSGGCLFRSTAAIESGARVNLQFALPGWTRLIATPARSVNRQGDGTGFSFIDTPLRDRESISGFVCSTLVGH